MSIKIKRNDLGNCINFEGSSMPVYWNACLSGEVEPSDSTLVNIVNDIKTAESGKNVYEFFRIPFTEFVDADSNAFANAQEVADYIDVNGNVTIAQGVTYKGIWNVDSNTPDITTDVSGFIAGDFYNIIAPGTRDIGNGSEDFINGDEVIFDGTTFKRKPYAGALIEYDSTSILLNSNSDVYADAEQGLEEPNGADNGWYFKNDAPDKRINWHFLNNNNAGYQITKSTIQGGYARIKLLTTTGLDAPYFSLYTTPQSDGFDSFWYRSHYVYTGDFTGIAANEEIIVYWGEDPSAHAELARVQLTLNSGQSTLSTAPDISNDAIYSMSLDTDTADVDSIEFITKELGYKNQQYLRKFLLEAKLVSEVVEQDETLVPVGTLLDFKLDDTSTSIMIDNGKSYGVNTIKAIDTGDGLITIKSMQGDITYFQGLGHIDVLINGDFVSGGLSDVINTLNELFTVGAFQSVVIADPYSTMIADVAGVDTTTSYAGFGADPLGNDVYGASNANSQNGYKTTDTIDQAGEYFTFDIRVEGTIGFGLIHSQASYDAGRWSGHQPYADPTRFGVDNSAHAGYQFSHWFHQTPNGSWTNYGSDPAYSMRAGWSDFNGTAEQTEWLAGNPIKVRVGIDSNSFISIETLRDGTDWVVHARTTYPVREGSEFHLGIKTNSTEARVYSLPKVHLLEAGAPTMYFRYIESPDNNFEHPLFATSEEAAYYDLHSGGTGTFSTIIYEDDPTFANWYKPDNGFTSDAVAIPQGTTFKGNAIAFTEITTLTNADMSPPAFADETITVDELSGVNHQLHEAGSDFTTTIVDTDNSGLSVGTNGNRITGTAPEVAGDNVANPSDTYTIQVVRTKAPYPSSTGTLTIVVNNLTAPISAISGFSHESGTTGLIDSTTMDDGSVVNVNNGVPDNKRFVIEQAYVEANVLPNLNNPGDTYVIGLALDASDFSTVETTDFDVAIVWEYVSATSHAFSFQRTGGIMQGGGTSGVTFKYVTVSSMTSAIYDYAIEIDGTSAWLIACNVNNIMNEVSPNDGGTFSHYAEATMIEDEEPSKIHMAAIGTSASFHTDDIEIIDTPTVLANLTPFTKAIDFSGGGEHMRQQGNSQAYSALRMSSISTTVLDHSTEPVAKTSDDVNARPWATVVMFKSELATGPQFLWSSGEGLVSGGDNIHCYLNTVNGVQVIQFQWNRQFVTYNSLRFSTVTDSKWRALYIAHKGGRYSGSNATATNLSNAFEVRMMTAADNFTTLSDDFCIPANWTDTGARMDRATDGTITVGARDTNYPFYGKIASMLVTSLERDSYMPTDDEIKMMIKDPVRWLQDYKVGNTYRANGSGDAASGTFAMNDSTSSLSTQVWLFGDTSGDSSSTVSNKVRLTSTVTQLLGQSLVANDLENVTVPGLTETS